MAPMRMPSVMPPAIARSGWRMSAARSSAISRKSWRVNSLSPVEIGAAEARPADAPLAGPAARGVRRHAFSAAPAEEPPDGRAERFTEQVPERDVDAGNRRDREPAPPELGQHVAAIERVALARRVVHHVP